MTLMNARKPLNFLIVLLVVLVGCGPSGPSEESRQIAVIEQQIKDDKIGLSEMLVKKRAVYRAHSGLDEYQEAYYKKTIIFAEQFEDGAFSFDQFMALEMDARQNMEMLQKVNCMKIRQENSGRDRSGLASTSGVVAIVSMAGLLAESAEEVRACR
jgi:hypothetical protein